MKAALNGIAIVEFLSDQAENATAGRQSTLTGHAAPEGAGAGARPPNLVQLCCETGGEVVMRTGGRGPWPDVIRGEETVNECVLTRRRGGAVARRRGGVDRSQAHAC